LAFSIYTGSYYLSSVRLHLQLLYLLLFFLHPPLTTEIYTLSLHDALPISVYDLHLVFPADASNTAGYLLRGIIGYSDAPTVLERSEEHTSELQSRVDLVCRLLLEKKKK